MTNAVLNTTQPLDHLSESQMTDIAYALNAIEPGAGAHDHDMVSGSMGLLQMLSGFEWGAVVLALCLAVVFSVPNFRTRARHIWHTLRTAFSRQVYSFRKG
ncbi:MAG: hypothetical protein LRY54_04415 [Alphaproteobacteria bacterium]|nr:hypothetical protein [Alphaproteobacteria bacterium]